MLDAGHASFTPSPAISPLLLITSICLEHTNRSPSHRPRPRTRTHFRPFSSPPWPSPTFSVSNNPLSLQQQQHQQKQQLSLAFPSPRPLLSFDPAQLSNLNVVLASHCFPPYRRAVSPLLAHAARLEVVSQAGQEVKGVNPLQLQVAPLPADRSTRWLLVLLAPQIIIIFLLPLRVLLASLLTRRRRLGLPFVVVRFAVCIRIRVCICIDIHDLFLVLSA